MFEKFKHFIQESRRELSRVNWPTREETMRLTGVVVAISVGIAFFLGAFDALFYTGVRKLVDMAPIPTPIEGALPNNSTSTIASSTTGGPNVFAPIDVKANGNVKVTTEKPVESKLPIKL